MKRTTRQLPLFGAAGNPPPGPVGHGVTLEDAAARAFAIDPANNVVLEASAGTGKTSVLVSRYVNLLRAGVDPSNILAITFTRQAAAEMRDRIIRELRTAAGSSRADQARWRELRDRLGEIAISTIDAFCLSLLREFPLEADLDPAFGMADETEVPRLIQEALDRTLAVCGAVAQEDINVAMVLARLGVGRVRTGLAHLLERRLVAPAVLQRFLASGPRGLTARVACRRAATRLADVVGGVDGGLTRFLADGPREHPKFKMLARELRGLATLGDEEPGAVRPALDRIREYFLTRDGRPRKRFTPYRSEQCRSAKAWRHHCTAGRQLAPAVAEALTAFDRDLNVVLARGAQRMFAIAVTEYERELAARSVLDFSDVLQRALDLLRRMDEFAQSRYRLESRYHHVLVDEFQDTSRAQWELVSLLIQSWGEGFGLVHDAPVPPSVFVVGDRKQSIYGFRDADVAVLHDAAAYIETLRPEGDARRSISHSFRAVPPLLAFVNDLFDGVEKAARPRDGFRYDVSDRFPVEIAASTAVTPSGGQPASPPSSALGLVLGESVEDCAARVAGEVARLLEGATVRDRTTGVGRQATPGDIAILFRSRQTHREFQAALESRGIPAFVYKGLGFFDADEIKDYRALLRYLADPTSELRTAALLRSRLVRITDAALAGLAGCLSATLLSREPPAELDALDPADRAILLRLRASLPRWVAAVDRVPPADLLDRVCADCAYACELRGPRLVQARENLKKMRGLVRRLQNRGFATLSRIADHVDRLSGDVSNAVVDAFDAVNLMTVHAAKGLEFPVVFLVELARGTGGAAPAIRLVADRGDGEPSVSVAPFRSEADDDKRLRDREETKRLLYVATTRARDRLYLSATLGEGVVKVGPGSFASVLPPSLLAQLSAAPLDADRLSWSGSGGGAHTFALVGPGVATSGSRFSRGGSTETAGDRLLGWRPTGGPPRVQVTQIAAAMPAGVAPDRAAGADPVVGRLVHRMLQRDGEAAGMVPAAPDAAARAIELMTGEERARHDHRHVASEAAALYVRALAQPDVATLLGGDCLFEVPFSMRRDDVDPERGVVIVRGTIECLRRWSDGRLTVFELKTGRVRSHHERQLALYVDAARALFPDAAVDGKVIYL